MTIGLIILGIIIAYCVIAVYVPNLTDKPRCHRCGCIKGDGKAVLYRGYVEKTCDGEDAKAFEVSKYISGYHKVKPDDK